MTVSNTYRVTGMTCAHCVAAVSGELTKIPGVRSVDVDLEQGCVAVTSETPLSTDVVRSAVDEAGYTLVDTHAS